MSSMLACLTVFTRNTLWGGPLLVVDALLHQGRPGGWVVGSMGFPFLVSPCWEKRVCSSLPAEYQCTAIQPAAGLPSLCFCFCFFLFFFYGHILFPKFPLCLLHRFGNFTSFFEDITFTLQSFIGPLSSVIFDFCSVEFIASVKLFFLKSVVNCLLFLRIHVGLFYLQEFTSFHCGK